MTMSTRSQFEFKWYSPEISLCTTQQTMRLSVLFAFIHFYSFCAGARVVLFKFRLQYRFVSFYLRSVECECAVRAAVRLCWSHNTDWNLSPASRWNRLMPHGASLLTFSIFFSPSLYLILVVGAAAWGLLQDSQTKVVTAEIAIKKNNKSHSCSSSHGEHFPLGSV